MAKSPKIENTGISAVIYSRYSSHAQKDVSIEQQVEECLEYARTNNLTVTHTYADRHLTARSDRRPEFQKMMRDAGHARFDVIIAYKSNRIARNMLHALSYEEKLYQQGIRIVYVKEEFGDNAAGRFALRTMMNVNQFYSENMGEDILRGMTDNAENNLVNSGSLPLGYRKGEDGRFAIDESAARVVREIYRRFQAGDSLADLARDLNERGIKTSRGNAWGKNSFHMLLSNERYTGVYIWGKVRNEGGMPKIIDRGQFDEVQGMMKISKQIKGRKSPNTDYLLTGKLFCGLCKSPMVGWSGTSASGRAYHYYVCKGRQNKICDKKNAGRAWAEKTVASALVQYVLQDHVIEQIADNALAYYAKRKEWDRVKEIKEELSGVTKSIDNLMQAILKGILTDTTKDKMMELEADKKNLEAILHIEQRALPEITRNKVIFWMESFRGNDISNKKFQKALFDTFLVAAYLYDDELRLVFNYAGADNEILLNFKKEDIEKAIDEPSSAVRITPIVAHQIVKSEILD